MKTILFDVDDVICTNHFIPVMGEYVGKKFKEEDFTNVHVEEELFPNKKDRDAFYDYFLTVNSYQYAHLKEGAYGVLQRLVKKYNVILLTSACHHERQLEFGRQFTDKWNYLLKTLPFFPPENIIFANKKDILIADMIVDDKMDNLKGNYSHKVLFTCFHNHNITDETLNKQGIARINNWADLETYINKVLAD